MDFSLPNATQGGELWALTSESLACPHMGGLWVWGCWKQLFGSSKVQMAFPEKTQIFSTLGTPKRGGGGLPTPHQPICLLGIGTGAQRQVGAVTPAPSTPRSFPVPP